MGRSDDLKTGRPGSPLVVGDEGFGAVSLDIAPDSGSADALPAGKTGVGHLYEVGVENSSL